MIFLLLLWGMVFSMCGPLEFSSTNARRNEKCYEVQSLALMVEGFALAKGRPPRDFTEIPQLDAWRAKRGEFSSYTNLSAFSYWPKNYRTGWWIVGLEFVEGGEAYVVGTDGTNPPEVLRKEECVERVGPG